MKKRNLIVLALASCTALWAQTYEKTDYGVKFQTASPVLNGEVIFYAPSIVRVVKYPSAEMPEKKSYPIIKTPEKVDITYTQDGNEVQMTTSNMTVTLDITTGKVVYTDGKGKTLLQEKEMGTNFVARKDVTKDAYTVSQSFVLHPDWR